MARVLLNRLFPTIAQENTPESQCGFRSNRVMTDMIFVLRQIQEKCREQNMGLYAAFVDLSIVFDTVSRDGLWKILAHLGCPLKFLTILGLQNLMIKLPKVHAKLPVVHSRLSLGPCITIGGQDLPRGHKGMLTWVTCAPSTKH